MTTPRQEVPVRAFLRLRPPTTQREQERTPSVQVLEDGKRIRVAEEGSSSGTDYEWEGILDESATSEHVYETSCSHIPQHLIADGMHCTVAAYGATQSGKTHTMTGLLPHLLQGVFDQLNEQKGAECSVRCSVVEIYLERMRDLLHDRHPAEDGVVQMRPTGHLTGCAAVSCWNAADTLQMIHTALAARTVTSSSRSTAVIQLMIQQTRATGEQMQSRLLLLDLLGSELLQPSSDTLEATQVSISLKAMHKQIRALANSKPLIPVADLPAVTRLLSAQFTGPGAAHTTLLCTATRYHRSLSSHFLKFASDCQRCTTHPLSNQAYHTPDLNTTAEYQHSAERWQRWAEQLAKECQRLRDRQSWDRQLWPLIEQIANKSDATSGDTPSATAGDTTVDRMRQYAQYKQALTQCAAAQAERDQLCSDVAILQAETVRCTQAHAQLAQQVEQLQRDNRVLHARKRQAEETLRVAQFREAEATVFLRQLRKFYVRLVQTATVRGSSGNSTSEEQSVLQQQLVDMDQFMLQSGLLDESEVGSMDAVATDPRPTRASLERSIAQTEREAIKTSEEAEATPTEGQQQTEEGASADDSSTVVSLEPERPVPVSVVDKEESPLTIEARQKLYQTPSGRYLAMRDQILETELFQALEANVQLKAQLDEEKTNVQVLRSQAGGPLEDKMRIAQEIRALKDQLSRKNNDLKAVIWKMNELHMVGKNLSRTLEGRGQRLASTEKSLADLQHRYAVGAEKNAANEQNMNVMIQGLQTQIKELVIPIWHLPKDETATTALPLSGRLVLPIPNGGNVNPSSQASTGEPGEWADIDYYPPDENLVDIATQTTPCPKEDSATQTNESVRVIEQADLQSVSIQTDDVHINDAETGITEDNIFNFMFMESPNNGGKERVPWEATTPAQNQSQLKAGDTRGGDVTPSSLAATTPLRAPLTCGSSILDSYLYDNDEPSAHSQVEKTSAVLTEYMTGLALDIDEDDLHDGNGDLNLEPCFTPHSKFPTQHYGKSFDDSPVEAGSSLPRGGGASHDVTGPSVPPDGMQGTDTVVATVHASQSKLGTLAPRGFQPSLSAAIPQVQSDNGPRPLSVRDRERGSPKGSPMKYRTFSHEPLALSQSEYVEPTVDSLQSTRLSQESSQQARTHQPPTGSLRGQLNKSPDRPKSAFLVRLQSQAKKKQLDAAEKSETPEFLRLFRKIGAANQNEAVLETAGAAPTRVAQRTSFETMKLRTTTTEVQSAPSTTWKPKKKKDNDDSDASSSDDSFAKSFMKGAQMAKPNGGGDSSSSSSDDSFAKSFMKGAQVVTPAPIPEADEDTNSSGSDHEGCGQEAQEPKAPSPEPIERTEPQTSSAAVAANPSNSAASSSTDSDKSTKANQTGQKTGNSGADQFASPQKANHFVKPTSISTSPMRSPAKHSRKAPIHSDSDSSSSDSVASPTKTRERKSFLDSSSSSDSDDSSAASRRRPVASNTQASVPSNPIELNSESSESDDKPHTRTSNTTPEAGTTQPRPNGLDSESSSDSSSEAKPAVRQAPAKSQPIISKGSSESESDLSDEDRRKPTSTQSAKAPTKDSDSDSSSSDDSNTTPAKPSVTKSNISSSSEDDSESNSSSNRGTSRVTSGKLERPRSDSSSDSSSDDSSAKHTQLKPVRKPIESLSSDSDSSDSIPRRGATKVSKHAASSSSSADSSLSDSSSDKRGKQKAQLTSTKGKASNTKIGGSTTDRSKFVIKDGKLVRRDGAGDAAEGAKSPKPAAGKRAKTAGSKGKSGKSAKGDRKKKANSTGKKPAFKIVNGKLVKNEEV